MKFFQNALLLEDEVHLAEAIKIALRQIGIENIDHALTLADARKILKTKTPQLFIIDRNLPDGDGIELCAKLRAKKYQGAMLILSARGNVDDRVEGLEAGADDYLPKPFSWEELQARLKALFRRTQGRTGLASGTSEAKATAPEAPLWTLDRERLRIFGYRGWETLTPLEFKLAHHLIAAAGAIIGREELLKEVWGFRFLPKTRTVDYFLGRLRKRFENDPDEPRHFVTVRGAGYRFIAEGADAGESEKP